VMMPQKDGFELCEILKTDERTSHIPIIMLTAKATEQDRIAGLKTGADAYLMKPFNKEELFVRLDKLISLRQSLQKFFLAKVPMLVSASSPDQNQPTEPSLDEQFLQKIGQVIEEKIGDTDLDIDYLCQAVHLSSTQLHRKMKALTGTSPIRFIRKVRLHKAKIALETTDRSIADVAYAFGFTDPNYFSRAFSKEFGQTPSKLRK
jgi:AraC-like DNA-binding protein